MKKETNPEYNVYSYAFSFKIEELHEGMIALLGLFWELFDKEHIDPHTDENVWVDMFHRAIKLNAEIIGVETCERFFEIQGAYKLMKQLVEKEYHA